VGGVAAQAWLTLIVSASAAIGVIVTWRQKNRADNRSEWWRRTQWAFECTFSTDDVQAKLGWKMLSKLVRSTLATKDDSEIVQVIAEHAALGEPKAEEDGNGGSASSERAQAGGP
jgi:hypothetical protein